MRAWETAPSRGAPAPGEVVALRPPDRGEVLTGRPQSLLEEERDFLLRSLRDLEAEHEAGDIDDADYEALKDDYTVRAAGVIRELAGERAGGPSEPVPGGADAPDTLPSPPAPQPEPGPTRRRRRWRWAAGVMVAVALGSVAGWTVHRASGTRLPGQTVSGAPVGAEKLAQLLDQAQKAAAAGDAVTALKDCRTILAANPNQPQALAEEGWLLAQTQQPSLQAQGLADLTRAVALAPGDQTAHLYRGIVLLDVGRKAEAVPDLQSYLDHDPAPEVKARVDAALAEARAGEPAP